VTKSLRNESSKHSPGVNRSSTLLWFRRDLRLHDHAALTAAAAGGRTVVACYVHDGAAEGGPGGASRWWLHGSLVALAREIERHGGRLLLRRGGAAHAISALAQELGVVEVHASKSYEPRGRDAEADVRRALAAIGVRFVVHAGAVLFDPERLATGAGLPYRMFTPFWRACLREPEPARPALSPRELHFAAPDVASDDLDEWRFLPQRPDWAVGFRAAWTPGEAAAQDRLKRFVAHGVAEYPASRDRPAEHGSTRLSPHLHFGEVSPRAVWHAVRSSSATTGADALLRELGWREFARYLLWHWPSFATESFRPEFARFPWRNDAVALDRWQRGQTGYPLVDAGMRELWHTGWMHNRVRMVAASFLVKHLLVPWQCGADWFWDTLVDADLASNSLGWQWVAGSGADAAPYFRVFNPRLQGERFDSEGDYVRRWVPELAALPAEDIHAPSEAPALTLRAAGVELGKTYPRPIVEHATARKRALEAYAVATGKRSR